MIAEQTAPWQELIPVDMTIEQDGKPVSLREMPDIKNAKDIGTLAKGYVESQREIGRRVRLPGKDASPEDIASFQKQLLAARPDLAPPASPADYGLAKPETLPEGVTWNDESAGKLATLLHKHGAPKALAADLIAFKMEMDQAQKSALNVSVEEGTAALKKEFGEQYDTLKEAATRLSQQIFKTPEEIAFFENSGLGNHPGFLKILMRLGPLAMQDSSFIQTGTKDAGAAADSVKAELGRIMNDPTHPDHAGWKRSDKATMAKVDEMYRKVYGTGKIEL